METKIFKFEESEITFLMSKDNNVMVNATEMAKIFDRRIDFFLKTDTTKEFISALEFTPFGGNSEPLKQEEIMRTRGSAGTYFHRILALKFAAWLSPQFEVWVYSTIEQLLFGKHVERERSFERTLSLQAELSELEYKVNKTGEDFERYLYLRKELSREKSFRTSLTKESIEEMQSLFYDEKGGEA